MTAALPGELPQSTPLLDRPARGLVGDRTAKELEKLDVHTVGDLLLHLPRRYALPGELTDMRSLTVGEDVTVMARVSAVASRRTQKGGALLQVTITDGVREMLLAFFARSPRVLEHHQRRLLVGRVGVFGGRVRAYRGSYELTHPDYQLVGVDVDDEAAALHESSRPVPLYPATSQLPSWRIRKAVATVLGTVRPEDVPDPVPDEIRATRRLADRHRTLLDLHDPADEAEYRRGRDRMRYEEAFVLQAALARRRRAVAEQDAVARPGAADAAAGLLAAFDLRLPFTLTQGQVDVGATIARDLAEPRPMQRLLQGEVGSGKTLVALRAMLQVVDSGGQAALLAPTEVLAAQHARTLRALLGPLAEGGLLGGAESATRVALLTGSLGAAARREALLDAASGRAGIVVGTHALLGPKVQFADLGLVVVDEQHRFGVEQRDALRNRTDGPTPHLLVMTATPIPRTVAMTVFGDLETSTLAEIPAGRPGITTHVVPADNHAWMERTWRRVREEVDAGHRVYVVCPRISPDDGTGQDGTDAADLVTDAPGLLWESSGVPASADPAATDREFLRLMTAEGFVPPPDEPRPLRAVLDVAEELRAHPALAGVPVGIMHGRLGAAEKDDAMARFAAGDVPVLVSTTVVEVGVDVPEATVMVVMDADRFGLSQLHQLRGRVGRGSDPGLCLLVSSAAPGTAAAARTEVLASTTDGFRLADADLRLRREGDVLGSSQSGRGSSLRLLRVLEDADLIAEARQDALGLVDADPSLERWPELRRAIDRWLGPDREEFLERS
ncbi:ATP-dependent DNA helicase RecG [Actinotalea sp. Marseille-Q4924]|uniref:ATP-dependent DNA helicase RecG n=1 Tax=Actinotalea sp. Marseille-Q4924 TaxID=2866571 RepID=UPI001CE480E8|nr:ATP-dependent DNA helicase RecG [Actinotalea sp. Marseille-Q4924]